MIVRGRIGRCIQPANLPGTELSDILVGTVIVPQGVLRSRVLARAFRVVVLSMNESL